MMIKTRSSRIEELTEFVKSKFIEFRRYLIARHLKCGKLRSVIIVYSLSENHPYDVCEVITTSIEGGNKEYLDWIGKIVPLQK